MRAEGELTLVGQTDGQHSADGENGKSLHGSRCCCFSVFLFGWKNKSSSCGLALLAGGLVVACSSALLLSMSLPRPSRVFIVFWSPTETIDPDCDWSGEQRDTLLLRWPNTQTPTHRLPDKHAHMRIQKHTHRIGQTHRQTDTHTYTIYNFLREKKNETFSEGKEKMSELEWMHCDILRVI